MSTGHIIHLEITATNNAALEHASMEYYTAVVPLHIVLTRPARLQHTRPSLAPDSSPLLMIHPPIHSSISKHVPYPLGALHPVFLLAL